MTQEKVAVSMMTAKIALQALQSEKQNLEKKLREVNEQIREIKAAIDVPVPVMEKKKDDFTLSANRVHMVVCKHKGLCIADLADVLAIDLNLQKSKETMKRLKTTLYSHLYSLKKKGKVKAEYNQEIAAATYFPADVEAFSLS